jgi:ABC-type arginine transport system ATPase subunit
MDQSSSSSSSSSCVPVQNLLNMPEDVLIEIVKKLNPSDFLTMRATCRSLRNLCTRLQKYQYFRIFFLQGKIQEVERRVTELNCQTETEQRNECLRRLNIKLNLYYKDLYYEIGGNDACDY